MWRSKRSCLLGFNFRDVLLQLITHFSTKIENNKSTFNKVMYVIWVNILNIEICHYTFNGEKKLYWSVVWSLFEFGTSGLGRQPWRVWCHADVSFACNERFAHDVYAKDNLHTYFSCTTFFAKTVRTQFSECCDCTFGQGLRFYCVKIIYVNIEISCIFTKFSRLKLPLLLNNKS